MDIGVQNIVDIIVDSTTAYMVVFSPLILLMGGILLAFGVSSLLIDIVAYTSAVKSGSTSGSFKEFRESRRDPDDD